MFRLKKQKPIQLAIIFVFVLGVVLSSCMWLFKTLYPIYYQDLIEKYATEYSLDPYLVSAIIRTESKFYEKAESNKNAKGLMQISPQTGRWASQELSINGYSEDWLFNPEINIKIGCWYLDRLRGEFKGDWKLVLAAYNGGSGNVAKWLQNPEYSSDGKTLSKIPFLETRSYVEKVEKNYKIYRILYK